MCAGFEHMKAKKAVEKERKAVPYNMNMTQKIGQLRLGVGLNRKTRTHNIASDYARGTTRNVLLDGGGIVRTDQERGRMCRVAR